MLPGSVVGAIVGYVLMRYGRPPSARVEREAPEP